ncbi:unnamed protein product [Cyclocybe aegerita]|uniref:Uncharacterized protein n=1 Tax=Cyclocybe aegerita TaxID=1973307 RepID=A0A8S0XDQ8_CYCAE|nr:unnamed protein product [Cyclocybe aegerita]
MTLSVADSGSSTVTLVSDTRVLWKDNPGDPTSSSTSRCPSLFPIDFEFPHTYTLGDNHWRMPPSFEVSFLGIPAFFVRCLFTLSVTITRARKLKGVAWTTSKTYITLVNHRPRIRPHRPIVMLDSVFASIKPVPEEWMQVVGKMGVRPKSGMRPIECHLFVPSVQTYALSDTIPFHLQIISSRRSLRELLPPSSALLRTHFRRPSSSCSSSSPSHHAPSRPSSESDRDAYWEHDHESNTYVGTGSFAIRVTIARQVVVEINERRRFRTFTLGLGRMWSVPPGWGVCSSAGWAEEKCGKGGWGSLKEWARVKDAGGKEGKEAEEEAEDADVCLDWQGEVKCWPEVTAGGFTASNLFVKVRFFRVPTRFAGGLLVGFSFRCVDVLSAVDTHFSADFSPRYRPRLDFRPDSRALSLEISTFSTFAVDDSTIHSVHSVSSLFLSASTVGVGCVRSFQHLSKRPMSNRTFSFSR